MTGKRHGLMVAVLAAGAALAACEDGLIRPPAPAGPASVRLAASLALNNGGPAEAYQKADQLSVRFLASTGERLSQVVPFNPGATVTVVSLQVPLEDVTETMTIQVELLAGTQPLFRGSGQAQLSVGGTSEVEIPIVPVVSSVTCAGTPFQIAVYNAARRLGAAALFASGDTVPNIAIGWSTSDATVATVNQAGDVFGLKDGSAQITCSAQGFNSTRQVQVLAVVATVQVQPPVDSILIGAQRAFTASLRDSIGNPIVSPRAINWSSSNNAIATVSGSGQATGVAPGSVTITATSGGVSATATLLVRAVPPIVRTISGVPVLAGATLQGGVNPQGLAAQSWFEWSTSPTLTGAQQTTRQQLAASLTEQVTTASLSNLSPGVIYYFRAAGSNAAGTAYGQVLSFRSNSAPLTTTLPATVAGLAATLDATVNPGGLATSAWFEWGTSPSLTTFTATGTQNVGAGSTAVGVNAGLTGLTAGVTYYYRAAASNQLGTTRGSILSFTTPRPPTATTGAPTGVSSTAATLQGLVNPNGAATTAWFEWGVGRAPTSFTSTAAQSLGAGSTNVSVSQSLSGLQPGTTYSYRVAANNALGTTRGGLVLFTALAPPGVTTLQSYYYVFGSVVISYIYGQITPQPVDTEVWFEYSTTSPTLATYLSTSIQTIPVGGDIELGYDFGDSVTGVVYFRAVARHAGGTTKGAILQAQPVG